MGNFKYSLEVCSAKDQGATYPLGRKEVVIGRSDADILIDDPAISTNHCLIRQGRSLTITDLQSRNGTMVNNRRILKETELFSGDILTIGHMIFRVKASSEKQRISAAPPPMDDGRGEGILDKLSRLLPRGAAHKTTHEKSTRNLIILLVALSWLVLILPLYVIMHNQVIRSRTEAACSLVVSLAMANRDALATRDMNLSDTSIVANEQGVHRALLLDSRGTVLAPKGDLLGKRDDSRYGRGAVAANRLLVQERSDGLLDLAMPINTYDRNSGKPKKMGVARIIFDPGLQGSGPNPYLVIGLSLAVYMAIALYFSRRITMAVRFDLVVFEEDCEEVITGKADLVAERYSPAFNELAITFNRILRKLGKSIKVDQSASSGNTTDRLSAMLQDLTQAAMFVNANNDVVAANLAMHNLLGLAEGSINNTNMLAVPCNTPLFQELLRFVCEATQDNTRRTAVLAGPSNRDIEVASSPVIDGHTLILLSSLESRQHHGQATYSNQQKTRVTNDVKHAHDSPAEQSDRGLP